MATKETSKPVPLDYKKYIYFLGADGYINGSPRGGGAKFRVGSEKVIRKPGRLYFIKDGFVYSTAK